MSSDEEEYSSEEESSEEEEEDPAAKAKAAEVLARQKALEEAKRKQDEINKRKAEVRKRLEEQSQKKAKKGFMTPERKKKLRLLLRKKAAEELKKEQERKAAERRKIIDQRCGQPKNLDGANEDKLREICKAYHERLFLCESQKWDLEYEVRRRDYEINELNIQVNDLRGKFIKPTLKKVSKYENKFAKLQKKAAEFNFRNQLKTVKKKEFELEDDKEKTTKPGWAAGGPGAAKKEGEEGAHPVSERAKLRQHFSSHASRQTRPHHHHHHRRPLGMASVWSSSHARRQGAT
ncbi:hypothetical protein O3P69_011043 [Scylla paramamosain]|uniref:Troponin I n=1 Tax=Scylla paramamosain TaxID=85552 RepID=A0AAW0SSG6_SCYPA